MKKITIVYLFSFLILLTVYAQEEPQEISLEEFIQKACRKDTVFQSILIDELALKYRKALTLPAGDLVVSITNQYHTFFNPKENEIDNSFSLSKLFPNTGTTVSADYTSSVSNSSRAVNSELDLYISQPIAENAFGKDTRLLDKLTGIEIDVAQHQVIEAYEDYLASLVQTYLDWYSAYKSVETAENSYKVNLKLLKNVKERQRNSIALPIDVNKINVQVLAKEENLVSLKNQYTEYFNLIKQALRSDENIELKPLDPDSYDQIAIDFDNGYQQFRSQSRTYQMLLLLEEKSSVQVARDADKLLPSIDLKLGYLIEGDNHGLSNNQNTFYGKIELDWPFFGQKEQAQHETSKIAQRKQKLNNQSTYADLYTNLKNIYEAVEREKKLISLSDEKIGLAEAIVKDETKNYSYGKVTLKDYIDEINKLEDNKFTKITHTIQLRKLIVEWLRLNDLLITQDETLTLTAPE
ncbi:MAG: TolC family protein [Candidatus Omnitrophica bacterium]|nr:TolC family protein [Candidatus Omnitrophota bacterium]